METLSVVRRNLLTVKGYSPYCGALPCFNTPRTKWDAKLKQFKCPTCGWVSKFDDDFIKKYSEVTNG